MTFLTGAKFRITYYRNECSLRFISCVPQGAQFSGTAELDTLSGNFIIYPNNPDTFTVSSPGGSMQFAVHNVAVDTVMITFVTSGQSGINTQANLVWHHVSCCDKY